MLAKIRVLVAADHYLPGFRWGGPLRSVTNIVDALYDRVDFRVVTRSRDLGSRDRYQDVPCGTWHRVGNAQVLYLSDEPSLAVWTRVLKDTEWDVLYLNSFFSYRFSILPLLALRMSGFRDRRVVLAPRGEFSPDALTIKRIRKLLFIHLVGRSRTYDSVVWQASTGTEAVHIREQLGLAISVQEARVLPSQISSDGALDDGRGKEVGRLSVVFLSRIAKMKNLTGALKFLSSARGSIDFSIYGPLEDMALWAECQKLIEALPLNIRVEYQGTVPPDRVHDVLQQHHIFILPTLGENYGHAIQEALMAGCGVLISDRTPWKNLRRHGVGWDLPLDRDDLWAEALEQCVAMDRWAFAAVSARARALAREGGGTRAAIQENLSLFVRQGPQHA